MTPWNIWNCGCIFFFQFLPLSTCGAGMFYFSVMKFVSFFFHAARYAVFDPFVSRIKEILHLIGLLCELLFTIFQKYLIRL